MLSTRFFICSVKLFSASLLMIACTEFDALCTNNDHCLPHQYCAEQACVTRNYSNTLDLSKDSPFEEDMAIAVDMSIGMDMDMDMTIAVDMLPDYEINEDPFTPLNPTCNVKFPNGESPVLNIDNLAITPRLLCSRDVLLMIAPVNNDIPSMSKCHSIALQDGEQPAGEQAGGEQAGDEQAGGEQAGDEQAGGEQAGGEQAGDEQAGDEQAGDEQAGDEQAGDEPTDRLAIYQYGRPDDQSEFSWYRRYRSTHFDPNTEFHLINIEGPGQADCNKGLLYISRTPSDKSDPIVTQSLMQSSFTETVLVPGDQLLNISPKTQEHTFTQFRVNDYTIQNQISTSIRNQDPNIHADCISSFESLPNYSQDLKTWNPTLTKAGFAWMQTHPLNPRFSELHLVSRNSITRPNSTECDQVIIDLYDMSTQDPNQLWRMPLQYDHEQYLYYCRYINGGACELHAKNVNERNNAYKQVLLEVTGGDQELIRLPTAKFSIYKNYLIYVSFDNSSTRFKLSIAQRSTDDLNGEPFVFEFLRSLETALRFPDLKLYLEKADGDRLNAHWISGHPQGWQVKTKTIRN